MDLDDLKSQLMIMVVEKTPIFVVGISVLWPLFYWKLEASFVCPCNFGPSNSPIPANCRVAPTSLELAIISPLTFEEPEDWPPTERQISPKKEENVDHEMGVLFGLFDVSQGLIN